MKTNQNEEGITLIEVLVSITILSVILISVMMYFPQMGKINIQNEDKAQAINTAKGLLIDWQESNKVKTFITNNNQTTGFSTNANDKDYYTSFNASSTDYIFTTVKNIYDVTIKISKLPLETSTVLSAHLITVQVKDTKRNVVTETYGYVKR